MQISDSMRAWFYVKEGKLRSDAEHRFLFQLCEHGPQWESFGLQPTAGFIQYDKAILTVGMDVSDEERRHIVRTLRVDFDSQGVIVGPDETKQYVTPLDMKKTAVKELRGSDLTPEACAEFAAEWLASELARQIEWREWRTPEYRHTEYVLIDTGTCLSWSDSTKERRPDLGPPDRSEIVHPRMSGAIPTGEGD